MSRSGKSTWEIIDGLRTLIFPQVCIMCESINASICNSCLSVWDAPARKLAFEYVPTYAVVTYNQQVSSVVLKAKEERNKSAQLLIAGAITLSMEALVTSLSFNLTTPEKALLVPIPSSRQAIRRRGESFLHPIMNTVMGLIKEKSKFSQLDLHWADLLKHQRRVRDQAGLTSTERAENLSGAFSVLDDPQCPVILVDDVVTTGSTLKNAVKAFEERKMTVLGAITACASAHQLLIR